MVSDGPGWDLSWMMLPRTNAGMISSTIWQTGDTILLMYSCWPRSSGVMMFSSFTTVSDVFCVKIIWFISVELIWIILFILSSICRTFVSISSMRSSMLDVAFGLTQAGRSDWCCAGWDGMPFVLGGDADWLGVLLAGRLIMDLVRVERYDLITGHL